MHFKCELLNEKYNYIYEIMIQKSKEAFLTMIFYWLFFLLLSALAFIGDRRLAIQMAI